MDAKGPRYKPAALACRTSRDGLRTPLLEAQRGSISGDDQNPFRRRGPGSAAAGRGDEAQRQPRAAGDTPQHPHSSRRRCSNGQTLDAGRSRPRPLPWLQGTPKRRSNGLLLVFSFLRSWLQSPIVDPTHFTPRTQQYRHASEEKVSRLFSEGVSGGRGDRSVRRARRPGRAGDAHRAGRQERAHDALGRYCRPVARLNLMAREFERRRRPVGQWAAWWKETC